MTKRLNKLIWTPVTLVALLGLAACGSKDVKPAVDTADAKTPAAIAPPPPEVGQALAAEAANKTAENSNEPSITLKKEAAGIELAKVIQTSKTALGFVISIESGAFETGSSYIGVEYTQKLQEAGRILKGFPEIKLLIEGYTDNTGPEARNKTLSLKRANKVKAILVSAGVEPERLTTTGYGPRNPAADNKSPEGRAANRRVEIKPAN